VRDRAVPMIVLVVEIEEYVSLIAERRRHLGDAAKPGAFGREHGERLTRQLTRPEQDELEDESAGLKTLDERQQPLTPLRCQRPVCLINRLVPVRPDADGIHAPVAQRVEILIARGGGAERVEQADAKEKGRTPVDLKSFAGHSERRTGRWRREPDQRQRRERRQQPRYCFPGTRPRRELAGVVPVPLK